VEVTKNTWYKVINEFHKHKNNPNIAIHQILTHFYKICIGSIISLASRDAWNTYHKVDGIRRETYASYRALPPRWLAQVNVIENEMVHIEELNNQKDGK